MKKYCCSFWSVYLTKSIFIPAFLAQMVVAPVSISKVGFSYLGMAIVLAANLFILCFILFSEFYIILYDDSLVIKNGIFPFWKRKVYYKNIMKINIIYWGGYAIPYMQIITGNTKFVWRYYMDRVRRKDFPEIIAFFRENDIEVKTKGEDLLT